MANKKIPNRRVMRVNFFNYNSLFWNLMSMVCQWSSVCELHSAAEHHSLSWFGGRRLKLAVYCASHSPSNIVNSPNELFFRVFPVRCWGFYTAICRWFLRVFPSFEIGRPTVCTCPISNRTSCLGKQWTLFQVFSFFENRPLPSWETSKLKSDEY